MTTKPLPKTIDAMVADLATSVDMFNENTKTIKDELEGVRGTLAKLEGLDEETIKSIKSVKLDDMVSRYEEIRSKVETLAKRIAAGSASSWLQGVEADKFSLSRAVRAVRTNDWSEAKYEKEVMDAAEQGALKGQSLTPGSSGGGVIPDQALPLLIAGIYARSVFIAADGNGDTRVTVIDGVNSTTAEIPRWDGGVVPYWIGDEDDFIESSVSIGDEKVTMHKLGVLIRLTDSMRRFNSNTRYNFEAMLQLNLQRRMAMKIDSTILYGRGTSNQPLGIAAHPKVTLWSAGQGAVVRQEAIADMDLAAISAIPAAAANNGGELDFVQMMKMKNALAEMGIDEGPGFAHIFSPTFKTRRATQQVTNFAGQTEGTSFVIGSPFLTDAELRSYMGDFGATPQIRNNKLPGASTAWETNSTESKFTDVVAGNLDEIVVLRAGGIEIVDDGGKGPGFKSDHWFLKVRQWMGIGYTRPEAIILCPDARAQDVA